METAPTSEAEEEKRKRREKEALLALFLFLLSDTKHRMSSTIASYLAGALGSSWRLSDDLTATLTDAHSHAAYLGRRLAGVRAPFGPADIRFGRSTMFGQSRYLAGLVNDVANRRYESDSGALDARITLYIRRLRGTSNESWALALPQDALIHWVLGGCNHCTQCPEIAANGPYTAHTLPSYPGDGSTDCLANCCCRLITEDGQEAFALPEDLN